ncbi:MAG: TetR family transcriptional regulator [Nitrospirae bacterium GWC2_57_9]|nr:MAG: TetR family transcriptional regulator [Nitrospirae bacterium GWC2_57_9]
MATKGDATRQKIIAEATRLMQQNGFEATSMSDLVNATGLQKGCLYFHFQGKDDLLAAVLEKAKADFLLLVDGALSGKTPGERLDNFLKEVLDYQRNQGIDCGCIFGNTAVEMSNKDKRIAAFVRDLFDQWTGKIRKVVKAAQQAGQVTVDIPADVLARHIIMSLEGGIMLSRLEKDEKPLKDCLTALRVVIGLKK